MITKEKYLDLLNDFPPCPVTTEDEFEATQAVINKLLDKSDLTLEEETYLDVLGTLVSDYESQQENLIPDIYGVELLKFLVREHNLKQKDLVSIFKTESIVSEMFNGKRQLTTHHIQELARFFDLSPSVFFPNK
jgi:HTH-type transcriptional regulator/antitoxin HigA